MPTYLADEDLDVAAIPRDGRHSSSQSANEWDEGEFAHKPLPAVLYVASSAGEGGIERQSVHIASLLVSQGFGIMYACGEGSFVERQCQALGIRTENFQCSNGADLRGIRRLASLIDEIHPDIVHVHSRRDFVPVLLAVSLIRMRKRSRRYPRVIIHSHLDKPIGAPARLARRLFASVADRIIAVSEAVKRHLIEIHGFAPSFIRVLYNGIDIDCFLPAGTKAAKQHRTMFRGELGIPNDALVIGMVGRLNDKGQAQLLAAAAPVVRARRGLWIVMVGPEGAPGQDMDRLREIARNEGISARLIMTGARDDVPEILPGFDLLAHLPDTESFGLALIEAMASGLPTIATDTGGCSEVVQNGVTGIVVPPGDGIAVQAAVKKLLIEDGSAELRKSMGAAGVKAVATHFSVERQVSQLADWYGELVAH